MLPNVITVHGSEHQERKLKRPQMTGEHEMQSHCWDSRTERTERKGLGGAGWSQECPVLILSPAQGHS